MKLDESEIVWVPNDQPDLLLVLNKGQRPPRNREEYLEEASDLLGWLVQEASPAEIEEATRRLRENLPEEEQTWLPPGLFDDPKTPRALIMNPASEGSSLHEWKLAAKDALEGNPELLLQSEARPLAEKLALESFLSRFL